MSTHSDLHSERGALAGEHPGRATNPVIKVIDLAWLLNAGVPMFRAILGDIILDQPRMTPAGLFYLLFPVGILYFASLPALSAGSLATAATRGAMFGFFTYMTYELTNHATLRLWSWNLVVVDTI